MEKELSLYVVGSPLLDDEFLLKFNKGSERIPGKGFMTKLNQTGTIPKPFLDWNKNGDLEIFVIKEEYRTGWKIEGFRRGQSTDWVELVHPFGFTVEIYCDREFENQLKTLDISQGNIIGEFKWNNRRLLKK